MVLRKLFRPTLRQQLEDGVRQALRRYADRRTAPDLRVYVSTDLLPEGVDPTIWSNDEADHLRRFSAQWAEDNEIVRAGLRVDMILLDTKREFAFVKPVGLEPEARPTLPPPPPPAPVPQLPVAPAVPAAPMPQAGMGPGFAPGAPVVAGGGARLDVMSSPVFRGPLEVHGETVVGRVAKDGVVGFGDRYMSGRHARLRVANGYLAVTDLDSKNRTFVNDQPIAPNQEVTLRIGDTLRFGPETLLRLSAVG